MTPKEQNERDLRITVGVISERLDTHMQASRHNCERVTRRLDEQGEMIQEIRDHLLKQKGFITAVSSVLAAAWSILMIVGGKFFGVLDD